MKPTKPSHRRKALGDELAYKPPTKLKPPKTPPTLKGQKQFDDRPPAEN